MARALELLSHGATDIVPVKFNQVGARPQPVSDIQRACSLKAGSPAPARATARLVSTLNRQGRPSSRGRLFVMVGLPASGKTTRAREIEDRWGALRLTPDDWMIPLFGESGPGGKRDVLEGRFVWPAMRALRLGTNVVLDFGVSSKDERSALRYLASSVGATRELVYSEVDEQEQADRVVQRAQTEPGSTFPLSDDDLGRFRRLFEVPGQMSSSRTRPVRPRRGTETGRGWAAERWPWPISISSNAS